MNVRKMLRKTYGDQAGAAMVEFAMVGPVLLLLIMGTLDVGHALYTRSVLEGETQKAARMSTMETASETARQAAIDANVTATVKKIAGEDAQLQFSRKAYGSYEATKVRFEKYVDANANGDCDAGESFEDSNGDGVWSEDGGLAGQGAARNVQEYVITITYNRQFPTTSLLGWSPDETLVVKTLLRNQPFGDAEPPAIGTCD